MDSLIAHVSRYAPPPISQRGAPVEETGGAGVAGAAAGAAGGAAGAFSANTEDEETRISRNVRKNEKYF